MDNKKMLELDEEQLEQVSGGASDTRRCEVCDYEYNPSKHDKCPKCDAKRFDVLIKPISIVR